MKKVKIQTYKGVVEKVFVDGKEAEFEVIDLTIKRAISLQKKCPCECHKLGLYDDEGCDQCEGYHKTN